jgi:O-antigen/teichoic acid export membrane protein
MSLSRRSTRGVLVFTAGNTLTYGLSLIATVIMAHLLSPRNFGEAILPITIAEFLAATAAWNFPSALLRERDEDVAVAFNTSLYLWAAVATVVMVIAVAIGAGLWFLESPLVAEILVAVVLGRLVANLADCFSADLARRFAYGRFSLINLSSQVFANGSAVALAVWGAGPWSVAWRDMGVAYVSIILSVAWSRWRFHRGFDRAKARELFTFGTKMIASRLGDMAFHRYDNLMVGLLAGTTPLGLYSQAYLIAESGTRAYGPALASVPLSTYSRLQGDRERTQRTYDFITYLLMRAIVPVGILCLLVPHEILTVLFGPAWASGSDMLRGLTAYAVLLPIFEHHRSLLVANNAVECLLRARILQLAVFLPTVPLLVLAIGGTGAALAVAAAMIVGTTAIIAVARPYARLHVRATLATPLIAGSLAAAIAEFMLQFEHGEFIRLASTIGIVLAVYLIALAGLDRHRLISNLQPMIKSLRPDPSAMREEAA